MQPNETIEARIERKLDKKIKLMDVALGRRKADLVLKNGSYVNVFSGEISKGDIAVSDGLIAGIGEYEGETEQDLSGKTVVPGLIDAHIHLESALVTPAEFAKAAVSHGTTTVIADPHEIANVMGTDGIKYMLEATENLPIDVLFMLPSCVPATPLDESGAELVYGDLEPFYEHPRVLGLAEMMNYVGLINGDKTALEKVLAAQGHCKKIDGHAPGLSGKALNAYIAAGIYSDHECDTLENALEKLRLGQYIMIREGTASKNLKALVSLLSGKYLGRCMFATDDKHPNDLLELGHIDYIIKRSVALGADPMVALRAATLDPARYFLLNHKGGIAPGLVADLAIVDNLNDFNVETVIKRGRVVYREGKVIDFAPRVAPELIEKAEHSFCLPDVTAADFAAGRCGVIGIIPGEILTEHLGFAERIDLTDDILKIAVVERYRNTGHIGIGYIKGYGLKSGAVATSVAHDSHNIIAVGTNDEDIALAVNQIKENNGGIAVVNHGKVLSVLPLSIGGIMSTQPIEKVNCKLKEIKTAAYSLGVANQIDPFMTLSFMSLPVIPKLKVTTCGVFDVDKWQYC